jgi:hypothetical protein
VVVLCAWLFDTASAKAQVGVSALPSIYQVPWLEAPTSRARIAADAGYGYFGNILHQGDSHQRALFGLAGAGQSKFGLSGEARLDARYDAHSLKGGKNDSGGVLDPRLAVRFARPVNERLSLGAQVGAWFPGKEFPKPAFSATSIDLLALGTVHASDSVDVSAMAGFRVDRSAHAAEHSERLSPSDFAALGLSSFNAVLAGLGARISYGKGAVLAEAAVDALIGAKAPGFTKSPMHASAGVDHAIGDKGTRLRVLLSAALSARPTVDVTGPLVPLLPRVWLLLGITQDLFGEKHVVAPEIVVPEPTPVEAPVVAPEPVPEPAQPQGMIRVFVRDTDWGEPLDADIIVLSPGEEEPKASGRSTKLNEGMLEIPVLPGRYEVLIEAKGYASQRRTLSVDEGGVTVLNVDLRPKEKAKQ